MKRREFAKTAVGGVIGAAVVAPQFAAAQTSSVSSPVQQQKTRVEKDAYGSVEVPAERYWGAQTERSIKLFDIGDELMPLAVIRAFGLQKQAAALANIRLGELDERRGRAIAQAAGEIAAGKFDREFPLGVWQTGSGTQTNMNANEVIANRAAEILGEPLGTRSLIHPNDHVNRGQSSNDSFPTVMHIASALEINRILLPGLTTLQTALTAKAVAFADAIKVGRTHLQDATPVTLGQEFGGYAAQIEYGVERVRAVLPRLYRVAQGGTAVGTGVNAHPDFARVFVEELNKLTGLSFESAPNKFEAMGAHDALVECSGALNTLAASVLRIANDIRLLASGPRAGFFEITVPGNNIGSSIMPGKINPVHAEALAQVAAQIIGNHTTITIAGASGNLELNVFKPVIVFNLLQSIKLLGEAAASFTEFLVSKIAANREHLKKQLESSLMLATALNPHIGYDNAARIVRHAYDNNLTLKQAAVELRLVTAEQFDAWVKPEAMLKPGAK